MQKLNFQIQNLKVDFITLIIPHFNDEHNILNLANYFHRSFGFNCFLSTGNCKKVETLFSIVRVTLLITLDKKSIFI